MNISHYLLFALAIGLCIEQNSYAGGGNSKPLHDDDAHEPTATDDQRLLQGQHDNNNNNNDNDDTEPPVRTIHVRPENPLESSTPFTPFNFSDATEREQGHRALLMVSDNFPRSIKSFTIKNVSSAFTQVFNLKINMHPDASTNKVIEYGYNMTIPHIAEIIFFLVDKAGRDNITSMNEFVFVDADAYVGPIFLKMRSAWQELNLNIFNRIRHVRFINSQLRPTIIGIGLAMTYATMLCNNLEQISLTNAAISTVDLQEIGEKCQQLKRLAITGCHVESDDNDQISNSHILKKALPNCEIIN